MTRVSPGFFRAVILAVAVMPEAAHGLEDSHLCYAVRPSVGSAEFLPVQPCGEDPGGGNCPPGQSCGPLIPGLCLCG